MENVFKLINEREKNIVEINVLEWFKRQSDVIKKYPNPCKNDEKIIYMYDSMVGQINEEIFETNEALFKNSNQAMSFNYQTKETIEEFIDVFSYLGSLIISTSEYLNIDIFKILKEYNLEKINIYNNFLINKYKERNELHDDFLYYVRRKIYDRKYHKPNSIKIENYEIDLILSLIVGSIFPRENDYDTEENKSRNYIFNNYKIPKFIDNFLPYLTCLLFCYDNLYIPDDERINKINSRINDINEIYNNKNIYLLNR